MYHKDLFVTHPNYLHELFLTTEAGQIQAAIPFDELAKQVPLPNRGVSGKGCKPWFDVKGGIALMFLKHHLRVSDAQLIEHINTNWSFQYFCGIQLSREEKIKDENLPGRWRSYLGQHMDMGLFQKTLAAAWKPHMKQTASSFQDATCYESYIEYPTHVKLIWRSCNEVHLQVQELRKEAKLRKSRNQYEKRKAFYLSYQKQRKKSRRQEKKVRKKLLKYLRRLLELLDELLSAYPRLSCRNQKRLEAIREIYRQQHDYAYGKTERIEKQIVSIDKPYIRPIVRGKEIKPVEFGAKVNKLQVDGISMIEHLNYEAFHEGNRLQQGVLLHHELFGACRHLSADAIYATNANRVYCKGKGIVTNFIPKGKEKVEHVEQNKLMRALLNKERSTRLEGSFGNEKNHYLLNKVKARTKHTETCWIFFGIHTANAMLIARRITAAKNPQTKDPPSQGELPIAA